jgi:hypothetical protein
MGVGTARQDFDRVTLVVDLRLLLRMSEAVCCVMDAATETEAVFVDTQLSVLYEEEDRPCAKGKP